MRLFPLLLVLMLVPLGARAAKTQALLLDLKVERGLDPGIAKALNELLAAELSRSSAWEVVDSSSIRAVVDLEVQKSLAGCTDDISCVAEVGAALGVDLLVESSLVPLGESFVLSLKVIDTREVRVVHRVTRRTPNNEDELFDAIKEAAEEIMGGNLAESAGAPAAHVSTSKRSSAGWLPWALYGGSGAALLTGVVLGVMALQSERDLETIPASEESLRAPIEQTVARRALGADIAYGVAIGAAVAGTLVLLWGDDDGGEVAFTPVLAPGVVAAAATVEF